MKCLPLSCIRFHDCCKQFPKLLGNSKNDSNLFSQCSGGLKSESRCWWVPPTSGGSGGNPFPPLAASGGSQGAWGTPLQSLSRWSHCLRPFCAISLCFSLSQGHLSLDLVNEVWIISRLFSKTLFPNKVTSQLPGICIDILREDCLGLPHLQSLCRRNFQFFF